MNAHQAEFPVRTMCRVLGVSPSGYSDWLGRGPSVRVSADAAILERIEHCHVASRCAGIVGVSRRRCRETTQRDHDATVAPDLVERPFTADGPDQLWVTGITYIATWAGFLYLAVVFDVWSRRVVGWCMATHWRTELVIATLECECLDRQRFKTQKNAPMAVFDFIEGFYNPHRRRSGLGNLSPINYEMRCHREAA